MFLRSFHLPYTTLRLFLPRRSLASRTAPITRLPRNAPAPEIYIHTGLRVALIGRPNVGKSTLFNRLASPIRSRTPDKTNHRENPSPHIFVRSVVDSAPGVTRDPRTAPAALSDFFFHIVDTPGLEDAVTPASASMPSFQGKEPSLVAAIASSTTPDYRALYRRMETRTADAVRDAHVLFFLIDAAEGVTLADHAIAKWVRSNAGQKPVVLIANKCDLAAAEARLGDTYELGFGDPVVISAEHGRGLADLYTEVDAIYKKQKSEANLPHLDPSHASQTDVKETDARVDDYNDGESDFDDELILATDKRKTEEPLQQLIVSIVGRPNVGKSTLLNRLVGSEASLVGPVAGVTRDAVLCEWRIPEDVDRPDDIPVWLVDTAGVRPRVKVEGEKLEQLCVRSSIRALRHSHVVVVVLDSADPLCLQDMKLLDLAVTEGRAVVLVVNKIDKITEERLNDWRLSLRYKADHKLTELSGVELIEMSAKNWENGPQQSRDLFNSIQNAREKWEKRIPTSMLNRFVQRFNDSLSVGSKAGARRNRIGVTKFITQKKIRPPMFRLDGSSAVSLHYLRSLTNAIRKEFGFEGVPIRVKRPSRRQRK